MVCVLPDLHNELLHQVPFDFMPGADAAKLIDSWEGSREKQMVAIYDPEKEVVICFIRKGEDEGTEVDCYKIQTRPAPPQAAEQE
jgi:hypothetical protein